MAERITTDQNSLAFDLPANELLGPVQKFGAGNARRQTDGELSWIATLTPRFNRYQALSDQFTLTVAVLRSRIPQLQLGGTLNQKTERLVLANQFLGNGMGGGSVQLITRNSQRTTEDLELRHNQWVLVSGMFRNAPGSVPAFTAVHAWYQVISVDDEPRRVTIGTIPVWSRFVTLQGPDWPVFDPVLNPNGIHAQDVRVTIMDRVESIREETVRMEGYSLWE